MLTEEEKIGAERLLRAVGYRPPLHIARLLGDDERVFVDNPTCWLVFQWPPSPPNFRSTGPQSLGSRQDPPGRTPSSFGERPESLPG